MCSCQLKAVWDSKQVQLQNVRTGHVQMYNQIPQAKSGPAKKEKLTA